MSHPLTIGNRLRKKYFQCPATRYDESLDEYMKKLRDLGVYINPCLKPAYFSLQNGLEYPGLVTTEDLTGYDLLVRVPRDLLLGTDFAVKQPQLQQIFKQPFYMKALYWQHRIILTYLLWILTKKEGIWYDMIRHMSKDVDFVCLWDEGQAIELNDKAAYTASRNDAKNFEDEWQEFRQMVQKYDVIDKSLITRQNYRWLYAHLFSRSFGRRQCLTLVPFCEFFNHNISRVFYDYEFSEGNPYKYLESKYEKSTVNEKDADQQSSSNETDNSGDYDDEAMWDYSHVPIEKILWESKIDSSLKEPEKQRIKEAKDDVVNHMTNSIDWTDGSVLFVSQILQKTNLTVCEYLAGKSSYDYAINQLNLLKQLVILYRSHITVFFQLFRNCKWKYRVHNDNPAHESSHGVDKYPPYNQTKFDYFIMRVGRKDRFKKGNQVYFRYGRLSNRKMLQCYGMTIEGNKYEHLWLHVDLLPYLSEYHDMLQLMKDRRLCHKLKVKLKRREFCMELVLFCRLTVWRMDNPIKEIFNPKNYDRELKALGKFEEIMKEALKKYDQQEKLQEKIKQKMSYHRYFCLVYQLEKVRIINLHLKLLGIAKTIVSRLHQGASFHETVEHDKAQDHEFWYLQPYLRTLNPDYKL